MHGPGAVDNVIGLRVTVPPGNKSQSIPNQNKHVTADKQEDKSFKTAPLLLCTFMSTAAVKLGPNRNFRLRLIVIGT